MHIVKKHFNKKISFCLHVLHILCIYIEIVIEIFAHSKLSRGFCIVRTLFTVFLLNFSTFSLHNFIFIYFVFCAFMRIFTLASGNEL